MTIKDRCFRLWPGFGVILLIVVLPALSACAGAVHAPTAGEFSLDASQLSTPAGTRRANSTYHVLVAEMALGRGDKKRAARQYALAVPDSGSADVARHAIKAAIDTDSPALAYKSAKHWADWDNQSLDAQRAATRFALLTGDAPGLRRYARAVVDLSDTPRAGFKYLTELLRGDDAHSDLAVNTLQKVAAAYPHNARVQLALGRVAYGYGRYDTAGRAFALAQKIEPDLSAATFLLARVRVQQKKPKAARLVLTGVSGTAKKRAQYHNALAQRLLDAGYVNDARLAFAKAVSIRPDDAGSRLGLGITALKIGRFADAEKQLKWLYQHDQHIDTSAYYLGLAYQQQQHYEQAVQWYKRVNGDKHALQAGLQRARVAAAQKNLDSARHQLAKLRSSYPGRTGHIDTVEGELLTAAGQYEKALKVYDRGIADHPESSRLHYGRSLVNEHLGDIEAAKRDLHAILESDPGNSLALNALGYLLTEHTKAYEKARGYIQRALKGAPDNPAILDSMGWVQYRLGELDKARRNLERAYKGQPGPEVAAHLGAVRWQQGDHQAARKIWQHAASEDDGNAVLERIMSQHTQ